MLIIIQIGDIMTINQHNGDDYMATNENDSRVRRTKKLIRQGLVELSRTKSIQKITVKELTDKVEINRGTFYLHYNDVYSLIESIEDEVFSEFEEEMASISTKDIVKNGIEVCEGICMHFHKHMDVYTMLLGENGDAHFSHKIGDMLNEKIFELMSDIFPKMDPSKYDFAYNYGKFGLIGLVYSWCCLHPEWEPHKVAEMWFNITTLGLWGILGEDGKEALTNAYNSY